MMHTELPLVALILTVGLSATWTTLNLHQAQEQPVLHAVFCLEVGVMYALYMIISRILALALSCIEPYASIPSHYEEEEEHEHLVWDEAPSSARGGLGIQREALISSMYLGGSGCFLALPALSFWNLSVTSMLLLSLCLIGFWSEHSKHPELAANLDKASVLRNLRLLRMALYGCTFSLIAGVLLKDSAAKEEKGWPVLFLLAFVSPIFLRLALPASKPAASVMSPSQVLEAALPVSCLHAFLVLGWYKPISVQDFEGKSLGLFIPMMVLCPFCQVIILAFILRGFRLKQTLPTVVVLAITCLILQQVLGHQLRQLSDWLLLGLAIKMLLLSAGLLYYRHSVTAPPLPPHMEVLNELVAESIADDGPREEPLDDLRS
jgi:hypothetical protein